MDLIATCAFGLEALVRRELEQLGYQAKVLSPGRVHFQGDQVAICRSNLWLRCADRILIQMGQFPAEDFGQLFDGTRELPWSNWIDPRGAFPVTGKSLNSQLSSVPACQRMVKKAIVESLRSAHQREELPESGARYPVEVALRDNVATLTLDTTGSSLHKRGYRKRVGPAPLKETLAAALIQLSFWNPERALIDPFCGSGTIAIEAAMIGRNMAPGLQREFLSQQWAGNQASAWKDAHQQALDLQQHDLPLRILATDIDPEVLKLARYHAQQAGVEQQVHFQCQAFDQLSSKRNFGCVITNPPYGERLDKRSDVEALYRSIPLVLRKLPTWSHFILTAYSGFERLIQRSADRRRKLYNGRIECTYYQFHGPPPSQHDRLPAREPASTPSDESSTTRSEERKTPLVAVFGGLTDKAPEQATLLQARLVKRARHLRRWPTKMGISCYRLYDRDIPEIPLAIDRYEDHLHIAEYDRPHDRSLAQHADWLDLMVQAAGQALDVPRQNIFLKRRERQSGKNQYQKQAQQNYTIIANEGSLKFLVNLSDYLDTGLFLDHRQTRAMVRQQAEGRRVLNLFGYTGSFSVYAAAGGAESSVTVDLSPRYLDWAQENMELNGLQSPRHQFVSSDAMTFLKELPSGAEYDLAIVDPPTYSNSKRISSDWDIQRDHLELLSLLLTKLTRGGVIFFSTNFKRFKLSESELQGVRLHEISRQTVPEDFRNRRIHRCWRMEKE